MAFFQYILQFKGNIFGIYLDNSLRKSKQVLKQMKVFSHIKIIALINYKFQFSVNLYVIIQALVQGKMNRTAIKKLSYIGAGIWEGQSHKGVAKGPQIIRNSGLFKHLQTNFGLDKIKDYGDIQFKDLSAADKSRKPIDHQFQNLHILDPLLGRLNNTVQQAMDEREQDNLILTVGGDHSIGSTTVHASLKKNPNLKVIWVDAHPDFNNPYLKKQSAQNYHGASLAHISGLYKLPGFDWMTQTLPYENIVLIGIREIQGTQYQSLRQKKIKCFTMDHIDKYGIGNVMTMAMKYLDPNNNAPFHISFDVDGMDPNVVSQTGTLFKTGLSERQGLHIVRRVVNEKKLVSFDLVQINQEIQSEEPATKYRYEEHLKDGISKTAKFGVDVISSLFQKGLNL